MKDEPAQFLVNLAKKRESKAGFGQLCPATIAVYLHSPSCQILTQTFQLGDRICGSCKHRAQARRQNGRDCSATVSASGCFTVCATSRPESRASASSNNGLGASKSPARQTTRGEASISAIRSANPWRGGHDFLPWAPSEYLRVAVIGETRAAAPFFRSKTSFSPPAHRPSGTLQVGSGTTVAHTEVSSTFTHCDRLEASEGE